MTVGSAATARASSGASSVASVAAASSAAARQDARALVPPSSRPRPRRSSARSAAARARPRAPRRAAAPPSRGGRSRRTAARRPREIPAFRGGARVARELGLELGGGASKRSASVASRPCTTRPSRRASRRRRANAPAPAALAQPKPSVLSAASTASASKPPRARSASVRVTAPRPRDVGGRDVAQPRAERRLPELGREPAADDRRAEPGVLERAPQRAVRPAHQQLVEDAQRQPLRRRERLVVQKPVDRDHVARRRVASRRSRRSRRSRSARRRGAARHRRCVAISGVGLGRGNRASARRAARAARSARRLRRRSCGGEGKRGRARYGVRTGPSRGGGDSQARVARV